jgi:hypothetical protein
MATYTAPFQRDAIAEVVPRALELSSLSKSSLLTGRRRIRIIPQTGQTYGGPTVSGSGQPTIANILIQDSAGLLDMQSVVLSMNIQTFNTSRSNGNNAYSQTGAVEAGSGASAVYTGAVNVAPVTVDPYLAAANNSLLVSSLPSQGAGNSASILVADNPDLAQTNVLDLKPSSSSAFSDDPLRTAVLDDFAWSVFRRIQISLNSQLVDDLDYCGRRATTEVYMSATPDWYDTIGTVMGAWKYVAGSVVAPYIQRPAYDSAAGVTPTYIASYPIRSAADPLQFSQYATQLQTAGTGAGPVEGTFTSLAPVGFGNNQTFTITASIQPTGAINAAWQALFFPNGVPNTAGIVTEYEFRVAVSAGAANAFQVSSVITLAVATNIVAGSLQVTTAAAYIGGSMAYDTGAAGIGVSSMSGAGNPSIEVFNQTAVAIIDPINVGAIRIAPETANGVVVPSAVYGAFPAGNLNPLLPYVAGQAGLRNVGSLSAGIPYNASSAAREDVIGKVYNASAFFKNVLFVPNASSAAYYKPRPSLEAYGTAAQSCATQALWVAAPQGNKFSVPMGLLSHLFRQEQLFPLRNAGQLILQIQFADPQECCFVAPVAQAGQHRALVSSLTSPVINPTTLVASGSFGTPLGTYTVQQLELECDIVTAIPEYTAILDSICSRPADKGLAIAFDSHLSSLQQVTGTAGLTPDAALNFGSDSTFTLIASKGSENVRSFHFTMSPTSGLRNYEYLQNSTFPAYDIQQWQIRVGSVYYPAFPSKGLSKNYMEMLSSVNSPMPSVGQASLISYNMFKSSTPTASWINSSSSVVDRYAYPYGAFSKLEAFNVGSLASKYTPIDPQTAAFSDGYIGGYCFDNLKHAEPLSHDGLDTRAIAGGMIQLDFTCRPLEPFAVVFHIRFTRTIVLAENGVSIVG